jgi:hypothetical protein
MKYTKEARSTQWKHEAHKVILPQGHKAYLVSQAGIFTAKPLDSKTIIAKISFQYFNMQSTSAKICGRQNFALPN